MSMCIPRNSYTVDDKKITMVVYESETSRDPITITDDNSDGVADSIEGAAVSKMAGLYKDHFARIAGIIDSQLAYPLSASQNVSASYYPTNTFLCDELSITPKGLDHFRAILQGAADK